MHSLLQPHWKAVKRILKYLKETTDHGLHLTRSSHLKLTGCSDADWASDPDDRRSTSGVCVYLGNNLVTWLSKKQSTVSKSTTEAEYRSLAIATAEIMWLKWLLSELQIPLHQTPLIWCDNLSTVALSANPVLHARTKHLELDLYFVREKVMNKSICVQHVLALDQTSDIFTKALSHPLFSRMKNKLGVVPLRGLELREAVEN